MAMKLKILSSLSGVIAFWHLCAVPYDWLKALYIGLVTWTTTGDVITFRFHGGVALAVTAAAIAGWCIGIVLLMDDSQRIQDAYEINGVGRPPLRARIGKWIFATSVVVPTLILPNLCSDRVIVSSNGVSVRGGWWLLRHEDQVVFSQLSDLSVIRTRQNKK